MFNTASKRIGWLCLFGVIYLCGWITFNVVVPSLKAPRPTKPILKLHTRRWGSDQIAISPNGKKILCLYYEKLTGGNSIKRWNIQTAEKLPPITSPEELYLLSSDSRYYATYDKIHRKTHVYQTNDQKLINTISLNKNESLEKIIGKEPLAIIRKAKTVVSKNNRSYIAAWQYHIQNIRTRKLLIPNPPALSARSFDSTFPDQSIAISPDGSKVLSLMPVPMEKETRNFRISNNNPNPIPLNVKRINRLTGKIDIFPSKVNFIDPFSLYYTSQISNDNTLYAAVSSSSFTGSSNNGEDGSIWCYDLSLQKLRWKYFQQNHFPLLLKFSPDGTMLAAGGHDNELRGNKGFVNVINVKTGKLIHEYTEQTLRDRLNDRTKLAYYDLQRRSFSTLNFYLKQANLRTLHSGNDKFMNQLAPHDSSIPQAMTWSPDSKTLAVSYFFGDVKLWHVKE